MVTWSKIDSSTFPELITEFLSLHPRFECSELLSYLNNQRSRSQPRPTSQGTPEEEDEIGKHPGDGRRGSNGSVIWSVKVSLISSSPSSAAAIKASLAETLENGEGESSEDDLETFTDDDNTNNSFEFKKKSTSGKKSEVSVCV